MNHTEYFAFVTGVHEYLSQTDQVLVLTTHNSQKPYYEIIEKEEAVEPRDHVITNKELLNDTFAIRELLSWASDIFYDNKKDDE